MRRHTGTHRSVDVLAQLPATLFAIFVPPSQPMAVRRGGHVSGAAQHASNQGGAAQHAWDQGGVAQPTFAALPGDTSELNVAFYNVGIQISEVGKKNWKAKERKLVADIVKAANVDSLDILCLSELGAVDVGIGTKTARRRRCCLDPGSARRHCDIACRCLRRRTLRDYRAFRSSGSPSVPGHQKLP